MARLGRSKKEQEMKKPEDKGPPSDPPIQTPQANPPQDQQPALMEEVPVAPSQPATHPPEINADKTREIKSKVDTATKTMEQNIQAATQRGESLNDLQDKTQAVAESSKQFSKNAKTVQKNLWWKDIKFTFICILVLLIIVGIIAGVIYMNSGNPWVIMDRHRTREVAARADRRDDSQYRISRRDGNQLEGKRSRSRSREGHRTYRSHNRAPYADRHDDRERRQSPNPNPGPIDFHGQKIKQTVDLATVDAADEDAVARAMGFGGFDSTKGKHVLGNIAGAVDKKKKLDARQMLHKRKLYDVPLTRQDLERKQDSGTVTSPSNHAGQK